MKSGYQKEIPRDVNQTGNDYGKQRRLRIPNAAEHRTQHIIRYNKYRTRSADPDVTHSLGKGLLRRVQKPRKYRRSRRQKCS